MKPVNIKQVKEKKSIKERLYEAEAGNESTEYIFPFLWMHGETHERLKEEIDAIYDANIREFCLESRTHQEFGQEKWWEDMGWVLEYAKKRGMRVWLLDDKFFPTGFANAYINTHPELKRVEMRMEYRDFAGPKKNVWIRCPDLREGESIISVTAYRRENDGGAPSGEAIDLTGKAKSGGNVFSWSVPEGVWRIFYVIRTTWAPGRPEYIDMLSAGSCRSMIEAVYQPHFDHFKQYFGNTFAGFFSDEPCFANDFGTYYSILGRKGMIIPYRDDLCAVMAERTGNSAEEVRVRLPELFQEFPDGRQRMMRWAYMDAVSSLLASNFSKLLGEWCRERGVKYIGHVIEDSNMHQRLGQGTGHYFRTIAPMDMAGIDIVLNQYIPGMTEMRHTAPIYAGEADPEFFNYLLAMLPSSLSRLEPRMQGRTMCEIFGAFGWAEGVPMMKKMLDHMLAGGINHFVPHAFSPKFPDADCPPHFYAGGNNAQAPAFGRLMLYMRKLSHVLSGGQYPADIAVLYNAEAEWCGGVCETLQKTAKIIDRGHFAFDIVWGDILPEITVKDGIGTVRGRKYTVLVVPESEYLPPDMLKSLKKLEEQGFSVVISGGKPPKNAENGAICPFKCVPDNELTGFLAETVSENGRLRIDQPLPLLKYYRTCDGDGEALFLCSEDDFDLMRFTVELPDDRERRFYDAWNGTYYKPRQEGRKVEVVLPPSGSVLLVIDDRQCAAYDYRDWKNCRPAKFDLSNVTLIGTDGSTERIDLMQGEDLTARPGYERFHGTVRYEGTLTISEGDKVLRISAAGEIVKVTLDGRDLGTGLERDMTFDVSFAGAGKHRMIVDVVNSPAHLVPDPFSSFIPIPCSGLTGTVTLEG